MVTATLEEIRDRTNGYRKRRRELLRDAFCRAAGINPLHLVQSEGHERISVKEYGVVDEASVGELFKEYKETSLREGIRNINNFTANKATELIIKNINLPLGEFLDQLPYLLHVSDLPDLDDTNDADNEQHQHHLQSGTKDSTGCR